MKIFMGLLVAVFFLEGQALANDDPCAGEVGAAYGLCNAYCEAMDCDSNFPTASQQACDRVKANYQKKINDITNSVPVPCENACDDGIDCTIDVYDGTKCHFTPSHSFCEQNDSTNSYCNIYEGCIPEPPEASDSTIIFVTSKLYQGDLREGDDILGLHGADLKCTRLAYASELIYPRNYKAFIGMGAGDCENIAGCRVNLTGPYILVDGTLIASYIDELAAGYYSAHEAPINLDENGQIQEVYVWTGTDSDGGSWDDCLNWESARRNYEYMGIAGHSAYKDDRWTEIVGDDGITKLRYCDEGSALYCVAE